MTKQSPVAPMTSSTRSPRDMLAQDDEEARKQRRFVSMKHSIQNSSTISFENTNLQRERNHVVALENILSQRMVSLEQKYISFKKPPPKIRKSPIQVKRLFLAQQQGLPKGKPTGKGEKKKMAILLDQTRHSKIGKSLKHLQN